MVENIPYRNPIRKLFWACALALPSASWRIGVGFFFLFLSLPSGNSGWSSSCFSQCVSYDVHACIDVIDFLHVQGNQMWWVHQGGSNPGQHSSCSGDVLSVNGTPWGNWSTPFTLTDVTACMDETSTVTQCSNVCNLIQAPSGSNGWETIYKFDDSGPSAAHNYKILFTFSGKSDVVGASGRFKSRTAFQLLG